MKTSLWEIARSQKKMTGGQAGECTAGKKRGVGDRECATKVAIVREHTYPKCVI
jgi:hypothetical protein